MNSELGEKSHASAAWLLAQSAMFWAWEEASLEAASILVQAEGHF